MKTKIFKSVIERRIRYFEIDRLGIVYNSHCLEWFERGRVEFLREIGFPYDKMEAEGYYLPVKTVSVEFIRPIYFDNIITLETILKELKNASVIFEYNVYSEKKICVYGSSTHVCVDENFKIKKLPKYLIRKINGK